MTSAREEEARRIGDTLRRLLGPFYERLCDPRTLEIMCNEDGVLWHERLGERPEVAGEMPAQRVQELLAAVAGALKTTITYDRPVLECELLTEGSPRFTGLSRPVVSAPVFTIRKHAAAVIPLARYEADGVITARQRAALEALVRERRNILVAGGTASGKTTLLNALIHHAAETHPGDRFVILEDTSEVQCSARNKVKLRAVAHCPMPALAKTILRLRPDRIIVGEVRGREAWDLIKAMNTGHDGCMGTIHGKGVVGGLEMLVERASEAIERPMQPAIARAIHAVVAVEKADNPAGRRVTEIARVEGYDGAWQLSFLES